MAQALTYDSNTLGSPSANPSVTSEARIKPLGYVQITALTSAVTLSPPAGATSAILMVEGAAVRFRDDGTAPTASVGMPIAAGSTMEYKGDLTKIQFIGQAAGAILDVSFYQ